MLSPCAAVLILKKNKLLCYTVKWNISNRQHEKGINDQQTSHRFTFNKYLIYNCLSTGKHDQRNY